MYGCHVCIDHVFSITCYYQLISLDISFTSTGDFSLQASVSSPATREPMCIFLCDRFPTKRREVCVGRWPSGVHLQVEDDSGRLQCWSSARVRVNSSHSLEQTNTVLFHINQQAMNK